MYSWFDIPVIPVAQKIEVPPEDNEFYDLMYGINEVVQSLPDYVLAERQALGLCDELAEDDLIREVLERSSFNYRFPLSGVAIDTLLDRVQPRGFTVDDSLQDQFDQAWEANEMEIWEPKLRADTFLYGDAYLMSWPDDGDNPEDADVILAKVTNSVLSPKETRAIYDSENLRRTLYIVRRYQYGKRWRAELHYRDRVEFFETIKDNAKGKSVKEWARFDPDGRGEVQPTTWGEIAIKHYRTSVPYGCPVHFKGYGAQNAIAKLLVTEICTIEEQGWPSRYGLVASNQELDAVMDTPDWGDDENSPSAPRARASQRSQFRARPGHMQLFTGLDSAGQFDAANPDVFNTPVETFVSLLSTLTRTPLYAFKPGGEQPSGRARQIADAPLESHKKSLQILLKFSYRDSVKLMMKMLGKTVSTFEVVWEPTVMATDSDDWKVVQQKIEAGVPFDKAMEEAGYDPKTITAWVDEMQKFSLQESVAIFKELAESCSKLSGSAISAEQVHDILKQLLAELNIPLGPFEKPEVPAALEMGNTPNGQNPNTPPPGDPAAVRNEGGQNSGSNLAPSR